MAYNNYSLNNSSGNSNLDVNRNQVKVGISHPFFNDKLNVEVGSTSDWRGTGNSTAGNSFNITGDFRLQYALSRTNALKMNAFKTSNYDVALDKNIVRAGMGISWRRSFNSFTPTKRKDKKNKK
ncbi:MAG: hypothetical protein EBX41_03225 [Chitinophagia bacterium]|nr:hypothetical protein [Chitinophagia bacterium]